MASLAALLRRCLPPLNFITLHYAYFVAVCLAASVVFYCSSDPAWSISYTDSLFLVVSAMTEAGLNTVNLSQMTTWQQVLLWLLILAGGSVWVSMWTVLARRTVFARRYGHVVTAETTQGQILAARPPDTAHRATLHRLLARGRSTDAQQFGPLSREEREHLGRVEYRALGVLAVLVPLYLVLWQVLGSVGLGAWLSRHRADVPRRNGIGPWWLGVFNAVSAFNNSGMSLLDANMVPFQDAHYLLLTMGLLILAGNTAYPVFLRLAVWALLRLADRATPAHVLADWKDTLLFILRYPRRVYTNLFPARATWWLVFMLVLLNSLDWMAFELLNLGNPTVETIPLGSRIVDGLFQALGASPLARTGTYTT